MSRIVVIKDKAGNEQSLHFSDRRQGSKGSHHTVLRSREKSWTAPETEPWSRQRRHQNWRSSGDAWDGGTWQNWQQETWDANSGAETFPGPRGMANEQSESARLVKRGRRGQEEESWAQAGATSSSGPGKRRGVVLVPGEQFAKANGPGSSSGRTGGKSSEAKALRRSHSLKPGNFRKSMVRTIRQSQQGVRKEVPYSPVVRESPPLEIERLVPARKGGVARTAPQAASAPAGRKPQPAARAPPIGAGRSPLPQKATLARAPVPAAARTFSTRTPSPPLAPRGRVEEASSPSPVERAPAVRAPVPASSPLAGRTPSPPTRITRAPLRQKAASASKPIAKAPAAVRVLAPSGARAAVARAPALAVTRAPARTPAGRTALRDESVRSLSLESREAQARDRGDGSPSSTFEEELQEIRWQKEEKPGPLRVAGQTSTGHELNHSAAQAGRARAWEGGATPSSSSAQGPAVTLQKKRPVDAGGKSALPLPQGSSPKRSRLEERPPAQEVQKPLPQPAATTTTRAAVGPTSQAQSTPSPAKRPPPARAQAPVESGKAEQRPAPQVLKAADRKVSTEQREQSPEGSESSSSSSEDEREAAALAAKEALRQQAKRSAMKPIPVKMEEPPQPAAEAVRPSHMALAAAAVPRRIPSKEAPRAPTRPLPAKAEPEVEAEATKPAPPPAAEPKGAPAVAQPASTAPGEGVEEEEEYEEEEEEESPWQDDPPVAVEPLGEPPPAKPPVPPPVVPPPTGSPPPSSQTQAAARHTPAPTQEEVQQAPPPAAQPPPEEEVLELPVPADVHTETDSSASMESDLDEPDEQFNSHPDEAPAVPPASHPPEGRSSPLSHPLQKVHSPTPRRQLPTEGAGRQGSQGRSSYRENAPKPRAPEPQRHSPERVRTSHRQPSRHRRSPGKKRSLTRVDPERAAANSVSPQRKIVRPAVGTAPAGRRNGSWTGGRTSSEPRGRHRDERDRRTAAPASQSSRHRRQSPDPRRNRSRGRGSERPRGERTSASSGHGNKQGRPGEREAFPGSRGRQASRHGGGFGGQGQRPTPPPIGSAPATKPRQDLYGDRPKAAGSYGAQRPRSPRRSPRRRSRSRGRRGR